jgi:hypothetical protein
MFFYEDFKIIINLKLHMIRLTIRLSILNYPIYPATYLPNGIIRKINIPAIEETIVITATADTEILDEPWFRKSRFGKTVPLT